MLTTPVLLLIFNRPHVTKQVFEKIREIKPCKLYVSADGPRAGKEGEGILCDEAKKAVLENIDWDCQLTTLIRNENLGCKIAVSSAITWFFEQEEEGIILEDDTVPDLSFFTFCDTMLKRYRYDASIMHISGDNYQQGRWVSDGDYYFSKFPHIWGWATWRRAWQHYDADIKMWPAEKERALSKLFVGDDIQKEYWIKAIDEVYDSKIDTWDYQWTATVWMKQGKCILPNKNLVQNIGFGQDATHTKTENKTIQEIPVLSLTTYNEPSVNEINTEADNRGFYTFIYSPPPRPLSFWEKLRNKVLKISGRLTFNQQ